MNLSAKAQTHNIPGRSLLLLYSASSDGIISDDSWLFTVRPIRNKRAGEEKVTLETLNDPLLCTTRDIHSIRTT